MNNNDGLNVPYAQSKPRRSSSAMEHYSDIDYLRSPSRAGDAYLTPASVSRSGTLKKRGSMRQGGGNNGLRRKESTKSISRGGGTGNTDRETFNSAFFTPVPTSGLPTDRLVDRFSGIVFFFFKCYQIQISCLLCVGIMGIESPGETPKVANPSSRLNKSMAQVPQGSGNLLSRSSSIV